MLNRFTRFLSMLVLLTSPPATFLLVRADVKDDAVKKDEDMLQGTWLLIGVVNNGKTIPEADLKKGTGTRYVIEGNKILMTVDKEELERTFKIDPSKKPKEIDVIDKREPFKGIYELKGDRLIICRPMKPSGDRPKDFTSREGDLQLLYTLKREKK